MSRRQPAHEALDLLNFIVELLRSFPRLSESPTISTASFRSAHLLTTLLSLSPMADCLCDSAIKSPGAWLVIIPVKKIP